MESELGLIESFICALAGKNEKLSKKTIILRRYFVALSRVQLV